MTKATHTPGPWSVCDLNDKRHKEFPIMALGGKIASVFAGFGAHFSWEQSEANARLIAAAPELLEALKRCDRIWSDNIDYEHGCLTEDTGENAVTLAKVVRAAIKRATGDTQ